MNSLTMKRFLLAITMVITFFAADAQLSPPELDLALRMYGRQGSLKKDSTRMITDTIFFDNTYNAVVNKPYPVKNIITFKVDQDSFHIDKPFKAKIPLRIIYWTDLTNNLTLDTALTVTFDTAIKKIYTAINSLVFSGSHKVRVRIRDNVVLTTLAGVTINDTMLLKSLVLENRMIAAPDYLFNCTDNVVKKITLGKNQLTDSSDEVKASWTNVWGATEFDVEWTYIDSNALLTSPRYNNYANQPDKLFANNATRVTVKELKYNIPLLYDTAGALFVRVRPVMARAGGGRVEMRWSSNYLPDGMGILGYRGHENALNWQSSISFAEDGKRKVVIQYYDGSLRGRQTVTKDNTGDSTTVVAETMYDYQGRPVIQVLPAPTISSIVHYTRNFNQRTNNAEYDKDQYDELVDPATYCGTSASPMGTGSGASNYYSANNPAKSKYNKFIPDANRYPFTETEYTQDNTGRISRQSGVGDSMRLGSGHETKYFYGGAPDQQELDALFGTEAGDHNHYQKNMVRDANNQFSVSYVDMHGRTIATALAGAVPANLDKLDSYKIDTITEVLTDKAGTLIRDLVMESHKSLLVDMQGPYEFTYSLDPDVLSKADCNDIPVCYDCLYDLQITITDDCNNQKLPNGRAFDTIFHNFSLLDFDKDGICRDSGFQVSFTKELQPGNYEVTKKLSVSRQGMDYYRDSVFMARNTCITLDSMIRWQASLQPHIDCTTPPLSDTTTGDNAEIRNAMLFDMIVPSGQYANPQQVDKYSIFYTGVDSGYLYQTASLVYEDENGNPDMVYDDQTGIYVKPQQLDSAQFIAKFRPSWAKALLPLHPEYCKLSELDASYNTALIWDRKFRKVETYQEAYDRGFLNPTGITTSPFNKYPVVLANKDPMAAQIHPDSLIKYRNFSSADHSIWALASIAVRCNGSTDLSCANSIDEVTAFDTDWCDGDLDMAWRYFRNMYLQEKKDIIDKQLETPDCTTPVPGVYYTRWPSGQTLIDDGRQPHFLSTEQAFAIDQSGTITNPNDTGAVRNDVDQYYADNCEAYATLWASQLSPCAYTQSDLNAIISLLIEVCKAGADAEHPYGSRDIKPGTPPVQTFYSSFEDVINKYNADHPVVPAREKVVCNADLISDPRPYAQQTAYANKPVWTKPSECECEQLGTLKSEFTTNGKAGETFSAYLLRKYNTTIDQQVLNTLEGLCNEPGDCNFRQEPLYLPPVLQCYTGDVCISCSQMAGYVNDFTGIYGNVILSVEPADSVQRRNNQLFANYLNNRLGYSKQSEEYLAFMSNCGISASPANFCDTMQNILGQFPCYYRSLTDSLVFSGECNQRYWTIGGRNGSGSSNTLNNPSQFVMNDSLYFPAQLDTLQRGSASFNLIRPICINNDQFTIEFRLRSSRAGCTGGGTECTRGDVSFGFGNTSTGATPAEDFSFNMVQNNNAPNAVYTYRGNIVQATEFRNRSFDNFTTIKLEVSPADFKVYYGGSLIKTVARDGNSDIEQLTSLNFGLWGRTRAIDWVKVTVQQGGSATTAYYEEFTSATNMARPDTNTLCNRMTCEDEFVKFYNQNNKTTYTYPQLQQRYLDSCGLTLNACRFSGEQLCGKSLAVFPGAQLAPVDNCSDSSFFAYSIGTELYKNYRDSLRNNFDSTYRATCMQAYRLEEFTVTHQRAEYHYTLYYYDQGGNLVKTIPPAGVMPNRDPAWLASVADSRADNGELITPAHTMATRYFYNSLNQVIAQRTPDAGDAAYFYDRLGRLVLSQNARQKTPNHYSYTLYDYLGRISEVGELTNATAMTTVKSRTVADLAAWLNSTTLGTRTQVTKTVYDHRYEAIVEKLAARNLRSRVAWAGVFDAATDVEENTYTNATFYSYDYHGNVDTLLQDYGNHEFKPNVMNDPANGDNRWKKMVYRYDLISGKVNWVGFQPAKADAFYHRYTYDAENRLTGVETTRDSINWDRDAFYEYYRHGPLARMVLGNEKVQGMDYAYTLQGWLKGVNSTAPWNFDMGADGYTGTSYARDAFGYALHYYHNDYKPIGTSQPFASANDTTGFRGLYNGNIAAMSVYHPKLGNPVHYTYGYDQLNRLIRMNTVARLDTVRNVWTAIQTDNYRERVKYDPNGNILKYDRYDNAATIMDSLTYFYSGNTNKLTSIDDAITAATAFGNDLEDQAANNYQYDAIGNLVKNAQEGIDTILWNVYGKMTRLVKSSGAVTTLIYDAAGNRVAKRYDSTGGPTINNWHTYDAGGNLVNVYAQNDNESQGALRNLRAVIYGSSRVGVHRPNTNIETGTLPEHFEIPGVGDGYFISFERGMKFC